jgi:hypothetical protein
MKRFILALFAITTICTVSCKKESVNPTDQSIKKEYMKSGGGDKRPSGTYD